jgi:hypothetical protein
MASMQQDLYLFAQVIDKGVGHGGWGTQCIWSFKCGLI